VASDLTNQQTRIAYRACWQRVNRDCGEIDSDQRGGGLDVPVGANDGHRRGATSATGKSAEKQDSDECKYSRTTPMATGEYVDGQVVQRYSIQNLTMMEQYRASLY
jgi:hypothetical protein